MIIEHVLALVREMRGQNASRSCVFVSSNTTDYCKAKGDTLLDPLAEEFARVNLEFATNIGWALSQVDLI